MQYEDYELVIKHLTPDNKAKLDAALKQLLVEQAYPKPFQVAITVSYLYAGKQVENKESTIHVCIDTGAYDYDYVNCYYKQLNMLNGDWYIVEAALCNGEFIHFDNIHDLRDALIEKFMVQEAKEMLEEYYNTAT